MLSKLLKNYWGFNLSIIFFCISFGLNAYSIDFTMPVNCLYGKECFIMSYFNHETQSDNFSDYTCGRLSSTKSTSTDFALKNYKQMLHGLNVTAADDGEVKVVRDGVADISVSLIGEESVRGRECGNGIVIQHKSGYKTQYCHLKRGSILVKIGDKVEKGQAIAQVGLSGLTTTPYLQFIVFKDKHTVDPFTGDDPVNGDAHVPCGSLDVYPLWDRETERMMKYIPTALLNTGFDQRIPHAQGAREDKFSRKEIKFDSKFMVFWADIFGIIKGDKITLSIIDPNGKTIITETKEMTNSQIRHFQFIGKKPDTGTTWPLGQYTGEVILFRTYGQEGGSTIFDEKDTVQIVQVEDKPKVLLHEKHKVKKTRDQDTNNGNNRDNPGENGL